MLQYKKTIFLVFLLAAFVAGVMLFQHVSWYKSIDESQFHGTLLQKPRSISSFKLMGIDGIPFDETKLKGHWTLMFFGFTHCGSLCPTTMAKLAQTYHLLEKRGVKQLPQVVMVSIDPARDDLKHLSDYVKAFDAHFYGARGESEAIEAMTQEIGIAYAKIAIKDSTNYNIEHSGTVMLFNPQGQLNAFFTLPHRAQFLADDYMLLINQGISYS